MKDTVLGYAKYEVRTPEGKTFYLYEWHVEHGLLLHYKSQTGYAITKLKQNPNDLRKIMLGEDC